MARLPRSWRIARSGVLRRDVERAGLRGGLAITSTADESVEAGDEGFDVDREASLAVDQEALDFENCVKQLLSFKMLFAYAKVELRESLLLKAIRFAKKPHHFLAGLAGR